MNIIEIAKQAGLKRHQEQAPGIDGVVGNWADLKQFAALVAAQEREECSKVCIQMANRCDDIRKAALETAAENIMARGTT